MKKIYLLGFFMFLSFSLVFAQRTITGTVNDESGEPLIGANVVVTGSATGTTVDLDGSFKLDVPDDAKSLSISYTGFSDQEVDITASSNVTIVLVEGVTLVEVVKLAYGGSSKSQTVASAVTTIKSEDIEDTANGSFVQALQARAPGLNISTGNGSPGGNSLVLIRGVGSISGNTEPLFVIDGVPVDEDNFRSLNPADIESATVLKDASASGLYGNRAAGGVVLITTKRGKFKQPLKVAYSYQYGTTNLQTPTFEVLDSKQSLELERASGRGFGAGVGISTYWADELGLTPGVPITDAQIAQLAQTNTKWNEVSLRTGETKSHNLSFSSGGANSRIFASLGYFDQEGISKGSQLERYNLRTNFDTKTDKLRVGISLTANYSSSKEPEGIDAGNLANPFLSSYLSKPYMDPYNDDGTLNNIGDNTTGFTNVPYLTLNSAEFNVDEDNEIKAIANFNVDYDIIEGLTAGISYGIDFQDENRKFITSPLSLRGQNVPSTTSVQKGTQYERNTKDVRQNFLTKLSYQKQIDKHFFKVSAFTEYLKGQRTRFGYQQYGLDPRFPGVGAGFIPGNTTEDANNDGVPEYNYIPDVFSTLRTVTQFSTFGVLKYDYNSVYGFEGSIRRDGSSRFSDANKYGTFWSVAGRWNISEESFFNVDAVNNLKLRASYGSTGNDRVQEFYYSGLSDIFDLFQTGGGYENNPVLIPSQLGNPELQWETTREINVGLDFTLLNSRLTGNLDLYNRVTSDVFIPNPNTLVSGGFNSISSNVAELSNKGVELFLSYDILTGRKSNGLAWNVYFNGSVNNNEITSLPGVEANDEGQVILDRGQRSVEAVGHPYNSFFIVRWAGVNPANGAPLYYTKEGGVTETFRDEDRVFVDKSSTPKYQGGFGTSVDWKGISLDVAFSFVADVWRNNGSFGVVEDPTLIGIANSATTILDYWQTPGQITSIPALSTGSVRNLLTDRYLEDASYLRLRNIKLGYSLNQKTLSALPVKSIDFFIQAENLITFSKWRGFDPEFQTTSNADFFSFPNPKLLTFGLGVNF